MKFFATQPHSGQSQCFQPTPALGWSLEPARYEAIGERTSHRIILSTHPGVGMVVETAFALTFTCTGFQKQFWQAVTIFAHPRLWRSGLTIPKKA